MSKQLFWRVFLIFATGVVAFFYIVNQLSSKTEEGMSFIDKEHRQTMTRWGREAESFYEKGDMAGLNTFVQTLATQEKTWVNVTNYSFERVAGEALLPSYFNGFTLGRSVDWKIHLYFDYNPVMEIPFKGQQVSFLIRLPERMRPGSYWRYTQFVMHIVIPTILLALISYLLYSYIMRPLLQLQAATRHFSAGKLDARASDFMRSRQDEFSEMAKTFDQMAERIGEQITSQRHLISDLSHELRTPLTRLDIAVASIEQDETSINIQRIRRDSQHIRRLVDDTLTLAWLDNEKPQLNDETVDLVDLLDVLISDARFEFPDRILNAQIPLHAEIKHSCHRAAGQAIENILRNALRYTPLSGQVTLHLSELRNSYQLTITDQGCGVPNEFLKAIFNPFFRVEESRARDGNSFGLGLALAQRQLTAIGATVTASNIKNGGLMMTVTFPKQ